MTFKKEFAMVFGTPVDTFTRIKCKGFTLCQYLQYARKYVPLQLFKLIVGFLNVHLQMWKQAYFSKVCPEVPGPSSWRTTDPGHHLSPLLYRMVWESVQVQTSEYYPPGNSDSVGTSSESGFDKTLQSFWWSLKHALRNTTLL